MNVAEIKLCEGERIDIEFYSEIKNVVFGNKSVVGPNT